MRILAILVLVLFMAIAKPSGTVSAQFSDESVLISNRFAMLFMEQVNGYLQLYERDEYFMKWFIGLYDHHDASRARWQVNTFLMKHSEIKRAHPWEFSESLNAHLTQLLIDGRILLTISFSNHLNGFALLSHGDIHQE
ncbi:MAG: hypothetical protein WD491_08520, partial [Balneolales bacterium]